MVTKQKETMLVFPLLDIFGCVSNSSEACSTNSKKTTVCTILFLSPPLKVMLGNFLIFFPYFMRAGCFVRFCTDTLDNDLMVLRLQKNYMLLPSAIVRLSGGSVGVYFSIS